jgi:TolB protein
VTVTAPPRPPRPGDPVTHGEFDALVEALIEEARQRAQRRRRRNAAVVTLIALVGAALFALLGRSAQSQTAVQGVASRSTHSAATGQSKIAFISEPPSGGYCGVVYVMNADGSGQRRLTNGGVPGCGQEGGHAWSPDGRQIAIDGIYVMNADGSGQRRLTSGSGSGGNPAWSPDGRRIAFTGGRDGVGIYVMNADGSEQRRLIRAGVYLPADLAWSPDGQKIAFTVPLTSGPGANLEIYVVNADGSGQRRLTRITGSNFVPSASPAWSPDGKRITFVRNGQVWVMNADGSGQRRLTLEGAPNFNPAWSPDGRRIAFERGGRRQRTNYWPGSAGYEVHVMNADGSGQQRLTRGGSGPRWSPDGRRITYVSKRSGDPDIWIMNADGSGRRNLTRGARRESSPVWSPGQK